MLEKGWENQDNTMSNAHGKKFYEFLMNLF